jgi:anti-sigma regulatory factor (Ser/Thr protein kinase)
MITARMWLVNCCIGIAALTANVAGFGDVADLLRVVLACCVGGVAAGLVSYVFHRATRVQRAAEAVALEVSLSFFALVSASFFVSVAAMFVLLDVPVVQSRAWQVPLQVILGTCWGALAVLILDIRDRAIASEQDAIDHLAQLEQVRRAQAGLLSDIDESIRIEVSQQLSSGMEALALHEEQMKTGSRVVSSEEISQLLRTISDDSVRPLSHRMALSSTGKPLKPSWIRLWRHAMETAPLQPGSMAAILVVALVPNQIQEFGFLRGASSMALGLGLLVLICSITNRLMVKFPHRHFALMIIAFVLLQVNTLVSLTIHDRWQSGYLTFSQIVLHVLFSALIVSVTTTFPLWRTSRVAASEYFSKAIQQEQIEVAMRNSHISLAAASAAQVLHGEVQSRLLASALAIERLDAVADSNELLAMLVDTRLLLAAPFEEDAVVARSDLSLKAEVSRKASLWQGIVQVYLAFDGAIDDLGNSIAHDAGRVVEEAIANAVRHGKAKRVDVTVYRGSHGINISVSDDGVRHISTGSDDVRRGMGTTLFEAVSDGAWTMSRRDGGTVLTVPMAVGVGK